LANLSAGVGFVRKPTIYLKHGDKLELHAGAGIGSLFNNVIEEGKAKL